MRLLSVFPTEVQGDENSKIYNLDMICLSDIELILKEV